MPRIRISKLNLSEEAKKECRREQIKLRMRRARAKMDQAALEERRKKDRERYKIQKEQNKIEINKLYTLKEQRQLR